MTIFSVPSFRVFFVYRDIDGWMILIRDFTSFSTVFQSHHNDGWVIMKYCVQWNPIDY